MQCPACDYVRQPTDLNPINQCPSCKQIYSRARKAAGIEEEEPPKKVAAVKPPWRPYGQHPAVIGLMIAVIFAAAWGYGTWNNRPVAPKPVVHDGVSAQLACQRFVSSRLKAPSTASFAPFQELSISERTQGKFIVVGWVDAENTFGAKLRNNYFCSIQFTGANVQLLDLSIE